MPSTFILFSCLIRSSLRNDDYINNWGKTMVSARFARAILSGMIAMSSATKQQLD